MLPCSIEIFTHRHPAYRCCTCMKRCACVLKSCVKFGAFQFAKNKLKVSSTSIYRFYDVKVVSRSSLASSFLVTKLGCCLLGMCILPFASFPMYCPVGGVLIFSYILRLLFTPRHSRHCVGVPSYPILTRIRTPLNREIETKIFPI